MKCLPQKHKDLSSDASTHVKEADVVATHTSNLCMGSGGGEDKGRKIPGDHGPPV